MKIDFHSHILPGCDHGSRHRSTSCAQLELAAEAGIETICATSHFYPEVKNVRDYLERRDASYSALMEYLPSNMRNFEKAPRIILGAEVLICNGIARLPDLEKLCLEGTNVLLLEMPFTHWTESHFESVEELLERKDIRPVIAHADRYQPDDIDRLLDYEIPLQLNVDSLCSLFMPKQLKSWIEYGHVCALGSDIHGAEIGYSQWLKAEKKLKGNFDLIMERTEELIFG